MHKKVWVCSEGFGESKIYRGYIGVKIEIKNGYSSEICTTKNKNILGVTVNLPYLNKFKA